MLCVRGWWSSPAVGFLLVSLSCRAGHTLSARLRLVGSAIDAEVGAQTARAIDAALRPQMRQGSQWTGQQHPSRGSGLPRAVAAVSVKTSGTSSASQTLEAGVGDRILRTGDTGDLVRAVQFALTKLG